MEIRPRCPPEWGNSGKAPSCCTFCLLMGLTSGNVRWNTVEAIHANRTRITAEHVPDRAVGVAADQPDRADRSRSRGGRADAARSARWS